MANKVKSDVTDVTNGYLVDKLCDGSNAAFPMVTVGGVKKVKIDTSGAGAPDVKFKISSADTTTNYAENKLVAGSGVTITKLNTGGNEQLSIAASGGGGGGSYILNCPDIYADGNVLGDGNGTTLTDVYPDMASAQAAFPLAAAKIAASDDWQRMTIDFAASYCALAAITSGENTNEVHWGLLNQSLGGNFHYVFAEESFDDVLPIAQGFYKFDFHCSVMDASNEEGISLFKSIPADQDEANTMLLRHFIFCNGLFKNDTCEKDDESTCFYIGAGTSPVWENIVCTGFDKQWNLAFLLQANFINCATTNCLGTGIKLTTGVDANFDWEDASLGQTGCNGAYFQNCVSYGSWNMDDNFLIKDSSDVIMMNTVIQGPSAPPDPGENYPEHGIFCDVTLENTISRGMKCTGVHIEWAYNTAAFRHRGRQGRFIIENVFNQTQGLDAVINRVVCRVDQLAGKIGFVLRDWYDCKPDNAQFEASDANWCFFDCQGVMMPGDPANVAQLQNAALWATGVIPVANELSVIPPQY